MARPTRENQSQSVPVGTTLDEKMADSKIVIVGGGFAGLAVAKALRKTPAKVDLVDRFNHHVFQPLLYQVATSVLTPSQIATPIRSVLRNHKKRTQPSNRHLREGRSLNSTNDFV